jgi:hypothetical protein
MRVRLGTHIAGASDESSRRGIRDGHGAPRGDRLNARDKDSPIRDAWLRLGVLGALFASSVVFIHVPISLWAGNVPEFQSRPSQFLWLGCAGVLASLLAVALLLGMAPRATRPVIASACCAIGVVAWVDAYFRVGSMRVLNGHDTPIDFQSGHPGWEMVAVTAASALTALAIAKARRLATVALLTLNVGLGGLTTASVLRSRPARDVPSVAPGSGILRFSSRENVLVVLLDGLESDVVDGIFRSEPPIKDAFDGFRFYPDTAGVAPTTFLSLPAIHSGTVYAPPAVPGEYFSDAIVRRSFMNRFAKAGYDTTLINPVEGVCPAHVAACTAAASLLRAPWSELKRESLQLLDLSLFRVSPALLKRRIYNEGHWLTSGRMDAPPEIEQVMDGNRLLAEVSERLTVADGAPTLKFLHSLSTHSPYVLSDDCHTYASASLDHLVPQSRCALLAVASLLERLKAKGVYDNSVILVLADHGVDPGIYGSDARDERSSRWALLAGAANPVFLLKPRGSRGLLRIERDAVYLPDVGAMLCALSSACRVRTPMPVPPTSRTRPRRFNDYEWKNEFWQRRAIAQVTPYEIRGPVLSFPSWRRPGAVPDYHVGGAITCRAADDGLRFFQLGWIANDGECRASSRLASIAIPIADRIETPLELIARVSVGLPPAVSQQDATWLANGRVLGTWRFDAGETNVERRLQIPREVFNDKGELLLQLHFSVPRWRGSASARTDDWRTGIAIREMKLVAATAER